MRDRSVTVPDIAQAGATVQPHAAVAVTTLSVILMRANPEQRVVLVIAVERARYTVLPFTHTPPTRA